MKKKTWHSYAKSRNIVNRVYDNLDYFHFFKEVKRSKSQILKSLSYRIQDIRFLENLLSFFEDKLSKNQKNVEIRINLVDLIYDLNTLKQYLSKRKDNYKF